MAQTDPLRSGVDEVIEAAGGLPALAKQWELSREAIYNFRDQGWFPLERAKEARTLFGIPLRQLVRPDVREAIDIGVQEHLLSD